MAYIKIDPIKENTHLRNVIEYIQDDRKTRNKTLTDSYKCSFRFVEYEFRYTRLKAVSKKGNNIAWHIKQSFSPTDNVTPEQALVLGKELMKRMYPDFEYVIATHIDKEHIHNHIVMNSVSFVNHHKLNSNKSSLAKLQNIGDDICRENDLSVIDRGEKNHTEKLKNVIDETLLQASDLNKFILLMQDKGYSVKLSNKYISFKGREMKKYIRSSSISKEYSLPYLKYRIQAKTAANTDTITVYDNKIAYRSLRKMLKSEIDNSIENSHTYEDFIKDMQRKKFEVKQGVHLAFKGEKQERYIRAESIGFAYDEMSIKFRIEHKEEYRKLSAKRLSRIQNISKQNDWRLNNWITGKNSNIKNEVRNFVAEMIGEYTDINTMYVAFMDIYNRKISEENAVTETIKNIDESIRKVKTEIRREKRLYGNYSPSVNKLRENVAQLETERSRANIYRLKLYLELQDMNTAKCNFEAKDGFNLNYKTALNSCNKDNLERIRYKQAELS